MRRKHTVYKTTTEWLKEHFGLRGNLYLVTFDAERSIVKFHVTGEDVPEVPEGGVAFEVPLDNTAEIRMNMYNESLSWEDEFSEEEK